MQLEVESASIAYGLSLVVAPPKRRRRSGTVRALQTDSPVRRLLLLLRLVLGLLLLLLLLQDKTKRISVKIFYSASSPNLGVSGIRSQGSEAPRNMLNVSAASCTGTNAHNAVASIKSQPVISR